MFSQIFTLNKISHEVAEVIAGENVFSYFVFNKDKTVTVKFPCGIIHDTYPCHHCALEEVSRIWFLICEAERKILAQILILLMIHYGKRNHE